MSDQEVRFLERQALTGDLEAAYTLYRAQIHQQGPRQSQPLSSFILEARFGRDGGIMDLTPHSATMIRLYSPWLPPRTSGSEREAFSVNGVPHYIDVNFWYYPEHGWIPYYPDQVTKAEAELARWEKLPFDNRPLRFQKGKTLVEKVYMEMESQIRRADRAFSDRDLSDSASRKIKAYLTQFVNQWAAQNPERLREAGLIEANNQMVKAQEEMDALELEMVKLQQKIADQIVTELQISHQG